MKRMCLLWRASSDIFCTLLCILFLGMRRVMSVKKLSKTWRLVTHVAVIGVNDCIVYMTNDEKKE